MTVDPRGALAAFVSALERHLEAASSRRGENDPAVVAAYQDVAEAFDRYEDALMDAFEEVTPLEIYSDDDDDDFDDDFDDEDDDSAPYLGLDDDDFDGDDDGDDSDDDSDDFDDDSDDDDDSEDDGDDGDDDDSDDDGDDGDDGDDDGDAEPDDGGATRRWAGGPTPR